MDNLPRQKLAEIIAQYGHTLSDDPRRTEALLRDFCGAYKREIFVLVSALREQVAVDLLVSQSSVPREVLLAQLTRRLQENLALAEDAARWAVESWALALGVIAQPIPSQPPQKTAAPPPIPPRASPLPANKHLLCVLEGHAGWVNSVAFSPDGRTLASGGQDKTVRLWDVSSALGTGAGGSPTARWPLQGTSPVRAVVFSPDGRMLAWGGEDGVIPLWDVARNRQLRYLQDSADGVSSVAFSPNGQVLASAGANSVVLWDVENGQEMHREKEHASGVQSVAVSPDGRFLAWAGEDKTVQLWDGLAARALGKAAAPTTGAASGRARQQLEGHTEAVWSLAFSPDGRTLASASYDKTVRLWDVSVSSSTGGARGKALRRLSKHVGGVNSVAFSPDGQLLAAASSDTVVLWNVRRGRKMELLKGHAHLVQSVAFSPDGSILASASWDRTVRLWRVDVR